ncbi:capsule biosynthesis GfcC family protein [Shigella flexneri]
MLSTPRFSPAWPRRWHGLRGKTVEVRIPDSEVKNLNQCAGHLLDWRGSRGWRKVGGLVELSAKRQATESLNKKKTSGAARPLSGLAQQDMPTMPRALTAWRQQLQAVKVTGRQTLTRLYEVRVAENGNPSLEGGLYPVVFRSEPSTVTWMGLPAHWEKAALRWAGRRELSRRASLLSGADNSYAWWLIRTGIPKKCRRLILENASIQPMPGSTTFVGF